MQDILLKYHMYMYMYICIVKHVVHVEYPFLRTLIGFQEVSAGSC